MRMCQATTRVQVLNQPEQSTHCTRLFGHEGYHQGHIEGADGGTVTHRWFHSPLAIRKEQDGKA